MCVVMNLPNRLTIARIIMTLVFVALMSLDSAACHIAAYLIFFAATLTDFYDGKIARKYNLVTNFGKLLDPVADKLLVVSAFIVMMENPYLNVPGWAVVVILAREFLITGVRLLAAGEGAVIAANKWGKAKTFLQMTYAFTFLALAIAAHTMDTWGDFATRHPEFVNQTTKCIRGGSYWLIIAIAIYTVYSGLQFARANWQTLDLQEM